MLHRSVLDGNFGDNFNWGLQRVRNEGFELVMENRLKNEVPAVLAASIELFM